MLLLDALPLAFWHQCIECVNHEFDGFEILAVSARNFCSGMIVAKRAAELKDCGIGAGQFFDTLIYVTFLARRIFTESDQNVAQENGDTRN